MARQMTKTTGKVKIVWGRTFPKLKKGTRLTPEQREARRNRVNVDLTYFQDKQTLSGSIKFSGLKLEEFTTDKLNDVINTLLDNLNQPAE